MLFGFTGYCNKYWVSFNEYSPDQESVEGYKINWEYVTIDGEPIERVPMDHLHERYQQCNNKKEIILDGVDYLKEEECIQLFLAHNKLDMKSLYNTRGGIQDSVSNRRLMESSVEDMRKTMLSVLLFREL